MWTFKKAKSRNTSFPHNPSTEYADSQILNSPVRHHGLTWCRGVMWGVHRIEEFSPFIGQSSPLPTEQGLMHVNPWFIKKWIDLLLQSITVIKILATLPLPSLSPPPKWKVELKNTEADQDSKHAGTAWLHQELEKKPNQTQQPAGPLFRAWRHHFWEVLLRQLTSSFRLFVFYCRCAGFLHNRRLQPWLSSRSHCVTVTKGEAGSPQLQHSSKWFSDHNVQTLAAAAALKGHYPRSQ